MAAASRERPSGIYVVVVVGHLGLGRVNRGLRGGNGSDLRPPVPER